MDDLKINNPNSLVCIILDIIFENIISDKISLKEISNTLDEYTYHLILNTLEQYDFDKWKNNIYDSLVEIESNRWVDVKIEYNKYYHEHRGRNWYEDIEITLPDEEYINIEQHNHKHWNSYIRKVRELLLVEKIYNIFDYSTSKTD